MPVPRPARARQRGGTVIGFLAGLVVGLAIAVVVAIFVTRAPVPFVNKASRAPDKALEPAKNGAEAPDPNRPTMPRTRGAGTDPATPTVAPPPAGTPVPAAPAAGGTVEGQGRAAGPTPSPGAEAKPAEDATTFLLQAGAFRVQDDADGMKAKLALLGFEARVLSAQVGNETLYRVRVGPYRSQDEMTKARARLAENGIEATVIRVPPRPASP